MAMTMFQLTTFDLDCSFKTLGEDFINYGILGMLHVSSSIRQIECKKKTHDLVQFHSK